jgi:phosphoadenosine phosphosulfate reductase
MGLVRLGANILRWCNSCNLPILEEKTCPICYDETVETPLTPPGDCRPAFVFDIEMIRKQADEQFGPGCGELLLPGDNIVILNKAPAIDRMYEIISDGAVLGALMFDPPFGDKLIIRPEAARRMLPRMKGKVIADEGSLASIASGSNLMGPGVIHADEGIKNGDEVVVITDSGTIVATGLAKKSADEMNSRSRGVAVKVRWKNDQPLGGTSVPKKRNDWEAAIRANHEYLEKMVKKAIEFIRDLRRRYDKPIAVSFSGGKDSLATLSLALEAGISPTILFADTGLELKETVSEVRRVAREHNLKLLVEDAGDAFWENVEFFGPPGKDFRWCCKICKLGPTTRLISKNFPNGVISLIGQRGYESEQRMRKGSIWHNPWVPGQIGASPIQNWNALLVWLYIFSRKLKYNPWYERGLDRIGCFMCPSSDIAELKIVKDGHPDYTRWERYISTYRKTMGFPKEYETLALWRWKRLPPAMRNKLSELNVDIETTTVPSSAKGPIELRFAKGYRPCTDGGLSVEGVFSRRLDIVRVANLLNILGPVELHKDENIAKTGDIIIFGEGAVTIKGKNDGSIDDLAKKIEQIVSRAMFCVACGVCVGRCKHGALKVENRIEIDPDMCTHCGECLGPCPVIRFDRDIGI